jgi:serine/threonine-protein kinase
MNSGVEQPPPVSGLLEGKYQLISMIGRGGMGSVWEARHASLGTRFAIKFIEAEYADSKEARDRFDKEARAAATIQSKHAIQIYDHGVTREGKPYIVMELLVGRPLDKLIEEAGGALALTFTATILSQVARALQRAHERGIVHRDLKPENVFWVRNEEEEIAKVLDFGIAKISNTAGGVPSGVTSSTKTGAVLGTPFYMSPEQARGLRNIDHRTDVWSLGIIAFKCVTGKLPFDGESVGDLLVKICTQDPPLPSSVRPGLPEAFNHWFMRSLTREPERRFQSVQEQANELLKAAGLQAQSSGQNSQPMSFAMGPTVAPNLGTPPPGQLQGYGSSANSLAGSAAASATPAPGGMTAAPFTSSQPVPGVPSGGMGKVLGIVGAVMLLVGGLGAVGFLKFTHKGPFATAEPAPPASSVAVAGLGDKPPPPPVVSALEPPPPPAVTSVAAATTKAGSGGATVRPTGKVAAPPTTKPIASEKPTVVTPPPTPPPTPTGKKPPKPDDPGY